MSESNSDEYEPQVSEEKYVNFKKDRIKKAVNKGNRAKATREAQELIQYLGIGDSEMPIDTALDR